MATPAPSGPAVGSTAPSPSRLRRWYPIAGAVVLPVLLSAVLRPLRHQIDHTNTALVLVLVVVAVAASGSRVAGVLAALGSALWFDLLLTPPYFRLSIAHRADVETVVLLVLVGVAVSELALWGRAQQARASEEAGYLIGIRATVEAAASGRSTTAETLASVCAQLTTLLGLQQATFDYSTGLGHPRLHRDGHVSWRRTQWDVADLGLPTEMPTELLVQTDGWFRGRFLLTSQDSSRPSREQLAVAAALADGVGTVLARTDVQAR